MRYKIRHVTSYQYHQPVSLCQNQACLTPRSFSRQFCESTQLTIRPQPITVHSWTDFFGNVVHYFAVEVPHDELVVTGQSVVSMSEAPSIDLSATPPWEHVRDGRAAEDDEANLSTAPFLYESPCIRMLPEATDYARESFPPGRPLLEAASDLTTRIWRDFIYDPTATNVNTPTEEIFRYRRGVCQDFAHLQITCLRSLGLAARYVSGYLLTEPPPGKEKLVGADASHAWVSLYCPRQGWLDFDPTNNTMPGYGHITLAWGRDYSDVCPVKGIMLGGGDHRMTVGVDVTPIEAA